MRGKSTALGTTFKYWSFTGAALACTNQKLRKSSCLRCPQLLDRLLDVMSDCLEGLKVNGNSVHSVSHAILKL